MTNKTEKKKPKLEFYISKGQLAVWKEICKSPLYFNQQDAFRHIIREKALSMGIEVNLIGEIKKKSDSKSS